MRILLLFILLAINILAEEPRVGVVQSFVYAMKERTLRVEKDKLFEGASRFQDACNVARTVPILSANGVVIDGASVGVRIERIELRGVTTQSVVVMIVFRNVENDHLYYCAIGRDGEMVYPTVTGIAPGVQ